MGHEETESDSKPQQAPLKIDIFNPKLDLNEPISPTDKLIATFPIFPAKDHQKEFNPNEYLEGFYTSPKEDGAMQMVLFFLPGILYRLPEKVHTLLDLGAGPTVYIPIAVRHRVENVFSSDYSPLNRHALVKWMQKESTFDWTSICNWMKTIEATNENVDDMIERARKNVKGVLKVNVLSDEVIQGIEHKLNAEIDVPKVFDVVVTIFCLEYASETADEYRKAVHSATKLIRPGGHLIYGGVFHADEYCFGGKRFRSYFLTREKLVEELQRNGMCVNPDCKDFRLIINTEVYLLISRKGCTKSAET